MSNLHGHVSRRMWAHLWPWRAEEEIPIGHITNGVHIPTWLAYQMMQLYDRNFEPGWMARLSDPEIWMGIYDVDPGELWETHYALKNLLLAFVRRRVSRQCRRRGESDEVVEAARNILDPNMLTIGFARRFATYKRADLVLSDLDRMAEIVNDPQRPVQFVFAGKAHPADEPGKQLIKRIANLRFDPRFANRVIFIEDYDINVCRHLIQGVDVWLNNPRRPLEASGTSGQKAVLNGGSEPLHPRRLVGRGLRRHERLCHRQGDAARRRPHHRRPRRRLALQRAHRGGDSALLRPRHRRPAAALDPADDELHQHARLAVQRRPHGGGLREAVLLAGLGRIELPDAVK